MLSMFRVVRRSWRDFNALVKRGWDEVPEVVIAFGAIAWAIPQVTYRLKREKRRGIESHKYKWFYTVRRRDDIKDPSLPAYN